jgi:hypothetical protein
MAKTSASAGEGKAGIARKAPAPQATPVYKRSSRSSEAVCCSGTSLGLRAKPWMVVRVMATIPIRTDVAQIKSVPKSAARTFPVPSWNVQNKVTMPASIRAMQKRGERARNCDRCRSLAAWRCSAGSRASASRGMSVSQRILAKRAGSKAGPVEFRSVRAIFMNASASVNQR